ncbi:hypothetical protein KSP39_PZI019455 [Platanthera zijinensis]|uniref:Uncharacterized protein n=1 Tax=Platanthera zijinensis TaxID=2320716 RepID=A0AAP0B2N3_9ASPA
MVSLGEHEFASAAPARLYRHPRSRLFWDERVAVRVGEKLGARLRQIGVSDISLQLEDGDPEHLSFSLHYRRPIASMLRSVEGARVRVVGADELRCDRDPPAA